MVMGCSFKASHQKKAGDGMNHKTIFELSEELRELYIERNISPKLPPTKKEAYLAKIREIVKKYEGADIHTLSLLDNAAKRGKIDAIVSELESFNESHLKYIDPAFRRNAHYGARISAFFHFCYKKLRSHE